ncbi:MAG: ImmA/IrrE family metallo-endopeptidase [Ignavibacterium album]|uniref:ImmA/IrrE family metallo-endopeptidase n=1 Tax=Ignavibacterium album TaxID=591197 RepID=UPI0026ED198B|nr:ImmA/IrrE family metallo-endopeptidase [Ignavibacterium album]MBI5662738.1 ImmA/IrrE family metallo-endopeptidase [Ignavibacterium album]
MSRGKKIAEQIIDKYCIKNPRDLNLEEIANAEGLIIEESNISGSLGKIIFNDDYGLILINKSINNEGLKRFTIAHEMGHYLINKYSSQNKHGWTIDSFGDYISNRNHETEADHFAAELLMHKPWFSKFIKNIPVCLDLIKQISAEFNVSLTAAALRYAEIGQYPIAVIMSKDAAVQWSFLNEYFPCKYLPGGSRVPKESNAWDFFNGKEMSEDEDLIPAKSWFKQDLRCKATSYLYEQNIVIPVINSVMTILWQSEYD